MRTRIPRAFYDDHVARDLLAPPELNRTGRHVWIDTAHPAMSELLSDARFYADPYGPDTPGLRAAAKALLKALAPPGTL